MFNDENHISKISKDLLGVTREIMEGRGKKGAARHAEPDGDEWESEPKGKKLNKNRFSGIRKEKEASFAAEDVEQLEEAGYHAPSSPLIKGKKDTGYMRVGKGYGFSSSNPNRRINARAGLVPNIDWENDGKAAYEKELKRKEKFAAKAKSRLTKEDLDEFMIVSEEFGEGTLLDLTEDYAEIIFEHGVEHLNLEDVLVEEVESLQELSDDKLRQYERKAKDQIEATKKKGRASKATIAFRAKREAGMDKAKGIRSDRANKAWADRQKAHVDNIAHVHSKVPEAMAAHGFEKVGETKSRVAYVKHLPDVAHTITAIHHKPTEDHNRYSRDHILTLHSSTGWQSNNLHHASDTFSKTPLSKDDHESNLHNFLKKQINYHHNKGLEEG